MHGDFALGARAVDVEYAVGDPEAAWVVAVDSCGKVLALDVCDAVAVVADLVALGPFVGYSFED